MASGLIGTIPFGLGTVHDRFASRRGRPGGRNVDSRPRRFAVACCQTVSPNGVPPCGLRRNAFNSASVSTWWTYSSHRGPGPRGQAASVTVRLLFTRCHQLLQRHCCAEATKLARRACRST